MPGDLSRLLHTLTAELDHGADRILREGHGLTYSQFTALYAVSVLGPGTQRRVADWLGVTEPAAGRTLRALARDGLVAIGADPGGGNRRRVELTGGGHDAVARVGSDLEERVRRLVESAGVPYVEYADMTRRVLDTVRSGAVAQGGGRR
jgi:DNA-binding MarR family transcriptional regulator